MSADEHLLEMMRDNHCPECHVAADEIERLRLSLRLLTDEVRAAADRADMREDPDSITETIRIKRDA